jgi:CHRD domain
MSRLALRVVAVAGVIALLGVGSYAVAGGGSKNFSGSPLNGYEENPDISTVASGSFTARLSDDGSSLHYKLTYSGLEGAVTQSHVHFGKTAINGGVSFFLCGTAAAPGPAGTPACPTPGGTVEGDIEAADVIGPLGQGIEPGNLPEILAAMRAGNAYANVHSTKWLGGEIRAQLENRGGGGGGIVGGGDD